MQALEGPHSLAAAASGAACLKRAAYPGCSCKPGCKRGWRPRKGQSAQLQLQAGIPAGEQACTEASEGPHSLAAAVWLQLQAALQADMEACLEAPGGAHHGMLQTSKCGEQRLR